MQELEDTYGVTMTDEQAARIHTVGQAVDFVARPHAGAGRPTASRDPEPCRRSTTCSRALPDDLARQAVTHASWTERRADSYERLAFLGDSVLALAVTTHLYPRLEAERYGAGRLTKIRAQAVSGRSCRAVARAARRARAAAQRGAAGGRLGGGRVAAARPSACSPR